MSNRPKIKNKSVVPISGHNTKAIMAPSADNGQHGGAVAVQAIKTSHSGPLPPPDDLEYYEKVMPGAADRIFMLAEKEQEHRHTTTKFNQDKFWQDQKRRRHFTLYHALAVCLVAALTAYWKAPIAGATIMALSLAGAYLSSRIDEKTTENKQQEEPNKNDM